VIELAKMVNRLKNDHTVADVVNERMRTFGENYGKESKHWFSELCFCILTANSSAKLGIKIQERVGVEGFLNFPLESLKEILKGEGHRFYRKRAEFIDEVRRFDIKRIVTSFEDERDAREWLVENVKGIGYKEASHFLRNIGYGNVAILDRHILRLMRKHQLIEDIPKSLTRKRYLALEGVLERLVEPTDMSLGELDLYLWYLQTGEVLK